MATRKADARDAAHDDPLWYKDAIIYELHVRTFFDSDGDGMGDFPGLTAKLDYLQDLGVTALWLLPFYPSPWKDDGYDIADYSDVHPAYGTLKDFRTFLREAKKRGLRVITELVINHTSDQHPWFQRARRAKPGSAARDFYVWSDTPEKYQEARIIFQDFESSNWAWDPVAEQYFWHRFYSQQPDLNFDNPKVHQAVFRAMDFWFAMGVDGMRLDAVPYLYEREGTNCENLPETHAFLKELRTHVDGKYPGTMLLAEANQWPEDAVAYFGDGDECHMSFHFPVMPRLFMALQMEDRFPIVDIMDQTPAIPESAQWAVFLRNHDELTLEMVTDEERDYMYRMYAHDRQMRINVGIRRRLAPLMGNNRRKIELLNGLLFSLPGTPVLYYGDEIGMGDNVYLGDRNGVRTPMQWSGDRNAGFSRANPQALYLPPIIDPEYHYEAINVEAQQNNPSSLLWWIKRLIALRKRYQAFGRGTLEFLQPDNRKVLAFVREYQDQRILVVANLSRVVQAVRLDLSAHAGVTPVELSGRTRFPPVKEEPYFLTLGGYAFYWFALEPSRREEVEARPAEEPVTLELTGGLDAVLRGRGREALEAVLPDYMRERRWFGGKARTINQVEITETLPLRTESEPTALALVRVDYLEGDPELYALPLAWAEAKHAEALLRDTPRAVIARVRGQNGRTAVLYDALFDAAFGRALLELVAGKRRQKGAGGELTGTPAAPFKELAGARWNRLAPEVVGGEQSNTSILYGDRLFLKLFRRLEEGTNPDLEVGQALTRAGFACTPPVAGAIEYRRGRSEPVTVGVLKGYVVNEGDAWDYTLDQLRRYFENALAGEEPPEVEPVTIAALLAATREPIPTSVTDRIGTYLESALLLGRRTAEMHLALAGSTQPGFEAEPFSKLYQRSLYQSMRNSVGRTLQLLAGRIETLPKAVKPAARRVERLQKEMLRRLAQVAESRIDAQRIRTHGDYHLGQVLYTGRDFVIIDFEGEPARPLGERKLKRTPLSDVAGMLRSFHYAAYSALLEELDALGGPAPDDLDGLERWALYWYRWVSRSFLEGYLETAAQGSFLPADEEAVRLLLELYLLEKAVYELGYELNNRPDWVRIPLAGILQLVRP
jgi:maltose alpha-D-glucosyltransferase / alpha-amylase